MKAPEHNILVVEDDDSSYWLISETLIDLDVNLIHANNFDEAKDYLLSSLEFSVIILDYKLPCGKYGTDLFPTIELNHPDTPVLFETAIACNIFDLEQTITEKGYCLMYKPLNLNLLHSNITEMLCRNQSKIF